MTQTQLTVLWQSVDPARLRASKLSTAFVTSLTLSNSFSVILSGSICMQLSHAFPKMSCIPPQCPASPHCVGMSGVWLFALFCSRHRSHWFDWVVDGLVTTTVQMQSSLVVGSMLFFLDPSLLALPHLLYPLPPTPTHNHTHTHTHTQQLMLSLRSDTSFKSFLDCVQSRPSSKGMLLEELLATPLKRVSSAPMCGWGDGGGGGIGQINLEIWGSRS